MVGEARPNVQKRGLADMYVRPTQDFSQSRGRMANVSEISSPQVQRGERLSYKFQRLRERLRDAVRNGELAGKLPGERELARRFKANPKTLSKALTDLAAEGLLERSIGRGTYVRS